MNKIQYLLILSVALQTNMIRTEENLSKNNNYEIKDTPNPVIKNSNNSTIENLLTFFGYYSPKLADDKETDIKNINKQLSFEILTKHENDLKILKETTTSCQEKEKANIKKLKQKKLETYQKEKSLIINNFNALMLGRKTSFEQSQFVSKDLTPEEIQTQENFYKQTNTRLEERHKIDLSKLESQYGQDITDLEKEYENILEKHVAENTKIQQDELKLANDFELGRSQAISNQKEYLKKCYKTYLQNRKANQANTPKNEFHDEHGYFYGSFFILQADANDTLCSNCLDPQGNLKGRISDSKKISQATKQALLFVAKKFQTVENGVLTVIDKNENVYGIKHATDIRYFPNEQEFLEKENEEIKLLNNQENELEEMLSLTDLSKKEINS